MMRAAGGRRGGRGVGGVACATATTSEAVINATTRVVA